jgi:hypothetical protein
MCCAAPTSGGTIAVVVTRVLAIVGVICGLARAVYAQPAAKPVTVVIVETRDAPVLPTLTSQLELHGPAHATIETRAEPDADPFTFVARASEMIADGEASLVVWIAPVEHGYLVFAAGPWPERALIELARVDETIEPAELERTIALKVAGLLDTLLAQRATVEAVPPTPTTPIERRRPWRIEVAQHVAHESHDRGFDGRGVFAVGRAWRAGTWELAPSLAGYWQPSGTIEGDVGRAAITELGGVAAFELGRALGPIDAFVRPRVTLAVLRARGQSDDGRRGAATELAPYVGFEVGARRSIAPGVWVGVVAGAEAAAIHQEFLVDTEVVADLGRGRLHVGLALTVGL